MIYCNRKVVLCIDWLNDAIESIRDSITDGVAEAIFGVLFMLFHQPLVILGQLLDAILINPSDVQSEILTSLSITINSIITLIAICIVVYKLIEGMKRTAEGDGDSPGYYISQSVASGLLVAVLPWLVTVMTNISYALAGQFIADGSNSFLTTIEDWKDVTQAENELGEIIPFLVGGVGSAVVITVLFMAMLLIFAIVFIFQFVQRIADLIILQLLAPVVAVSVLADENNFVPVWWRELLAISVQLPLQVATFYTGVNFLFSPGVEVPDFLIGVGFLIITIKSPSFIRSMVYSTGSGRAAMGGMSTGTKLLMKKVFLSKATGK